MPYVVNNIYQVLSDIDGSSIEICDAVDFLEENLLEIRCRNDEGRIHSRVVFNEEQLYFLTKALIHLSKNQINRDDSFAWKEENVNKLEVGLDLAYKEVLEIRWYDEKGFVNGVLINDEQLPLVIQGLQERL